MRSNWRGEDKPEGLLEEMKRHADDCLRAKDMASLLGIEGIAAQKYFSNFKNLILIMKTTY